MGIIFGVTTVSGTSAFLNRGNLEVAMILVLNLFSKGIRILMGSAMSFGSVSTCGGVAVEPSPVIVKRCDLQWVTPPR